MSFDKKVILITGGNGGIGAACAEYFAKEGALLSLVGRNEEKFEQVLAKIKESGVELEPLVIIADVTVDAERIVSETIAKYGRLNILINNAGFGMFTTLESIKLEDFDALMGTNVRAVIQITQLAIPHLIETKGNVINVSSVAGIIAIESMLGYCMSKAALDKFTKCVAMEFASRGVRINSVNPAIIDTNFYAPCGFSRGTEEYGQFVEMFKAKHPLQMIGNTFDCVNSIAFLAHDKSARFITGHNLIIDGGITTKSAFSS